MNLNYNVDVRNLQNIDKVASEFSDLYLVEIESIDEFWGPTFRAVYDGNEYQKFMQKLNARIKYHDKEIERLCSHYYEGFTKSIKEILQVRTDFNQLQVEVAGIEDKLQKSIRSIYITKSDLKQARQCSYNVTLVIKFLKHIQSVLLTYEKMKQLIREKNGLKIMNELQSNELNKLANYRFYNLMLSNFQKKKDEIKADALSELKDFLENIRKVSSHIGKVAVSQILNKKRKEVPILDKYDPDSDKEIIAQDLIDFSPGNKEFFVSYYQKQRWQQVKLTLEPPSNMDKIDEYQEYLFNIVGFFIVEDHLLNTAKDLVNKIYLDELWKFSLFKMTSTLRSCIIHCTSPSIIIDLKELILAVVQAFEGYGFYTKELTAVLIGMQDQYMEVLRKECNQVFESIFKKDDYLPITVENLDEYKLVVKRFSFLENKDIEMVKFPKRFPFSLMVPAVQQQILYFINKCIKFPSDLSFGIIEAEDMIHKAVNLLLNRSFSNCLIAYVGTSDLNLQQLVQISVNLRCLEEASEESLKEYICKSLRDLRNEIEQQIYKCLKDTVDQLVQNYPYNWNLMEPSGQCSPYIGEFITFCQDIFQLFSNLPIRISQTACMCIFQQMAKSLLTLLMDDKIKQMSMGALQQINLDVIQCEQYAASDPVSGFQEGSLQMCFLDLRQLLDLFMAWDWSIYFSDFGKETSKYLRVNPQHCILLLEKIREADKGKMLYVLKRSERDKKRLLETVLKQLKQLTAST